MADRPGIMFYFSDWMPLLALDDATIAALFRAAIRYGKRGEEPELSDMAAILWGLLSPKIDRDGDRYENACLSAKYAVFCREQKKIGEIPLSFEEWKTERYRAIPSDSATHRPISDDIQLQQQYHFQPHSQRQTQEEKQGNQRGKERGENAAFSFPQADKSITQREEEASFEKKREDAISRLLHLDERG